MRKLGIALGGGGARCFAHLGVFEELNKNKINVDYIVASSTGAIIAALLANDVEIKTIRDEFYKLSTRLKWFMPSGFLTFSQKAIRDLMNNLLENKLIEKSRIPLTIVGTNLNNGKEFLFEKGGIVKAVCASTAHPLVYKPILHGKKHITDGGILNCIPADICRKRVGKNNIVMSCSLDGPLDEKANLNKKFQYMFRSVYIPLLHFRKVIIEQNSDIVLEPLKDLKFNFHNWRQILNFDNTDLMSYYYDQGRKEAKLKMWLIKKMLKHS